MQTKSSTLLTNHHRDLVATARVLRTYACGDDPRELIAAYRRFETMILAHIDAEETLLLPSYASHYPATAQRIRREHEELKRRLFGVAIDVELHGVRLAEIDELLEQLRVHAELEESTMYRWVDGALTREAAIELASRIDGSRPAAVIPGPIEHTGYSR